jgi:hypothetical protein
VITPPSIFTFFDDMCEVVCIIKKLKSFFLIKLNTVIKTTNERTNEMTSTMTMTMTSTMEEKATTATMSPAVRAAALKREKKAAAVLARAAGKVAAAARRAEDHTARNKAIAEETALIDRQIQCARRALGVGKNEPNPTAICLMIETLTFQMRVRLSEKGYW